MSAIDLTSYSAWRVTNQGDILVRDEGLYSGGATDGEWFAIGSMTLDADLIPTLTASGLQPVGRWATLYTRRGE